MDTERLQQLKARVKSMTPEEKMNLLKGLGSLIYENEPGTLEEKGLRLLEAIEQMYEGGGPLSKFLPPRAPGHDGEE